MSVKAWQSSEKQKGKKMNNPYLNPYSWQPPQQNFMNQKIQNLSSVVSTDAQVFYANSPQDMERINPQPNVLYLGINTTNKEIYIRQMNGMGLIDLDTYEKKSGEQQKNDLTKILDKLDQLMKGKDNVQSANDTISNEYANKGNAEKSPDNATV